MEIHGRSIHGIKRAFWGNVPPEIDLNVKENSFREAHLTGTSVS